MSNVKLVVSIGLVLLVALHACLTGVAVQTSHEFRSQQCEKCDCHNCDCAPCFCGRCDCHRHRLLHPPAEPASYQPGVTPYPAPSASGINTQALQETKQGIGVRNATTAAIVANTVAANTRTVNTAAVNARTVHTVAASAPATKPVASTALSENKQQGVVSQATPCMPCQRRPTYVQPYYVQPYVQPAQPTYVQPYTLPPTQVQTPRPAAKPHKLALFLDGSQRSQQVLQWFTQEPELARLRANSEFQVYSPGDTVYQARYAAVVPVQAMPAILWTYQVEGDVNQKAAAQVAAVGGTNMPWTSGELAGLMKNAYSLFLQVKNAPVAQAMAQPINTGINWENFASPQMILREAAYDQYSDCPGGQCPNDGSCPDGVCPQDDGPGFRPFARNTERGPVRDLYGMTTETLVAIALLVFAALVIAYVIKQKSQEPLQ